MINGSLNPVGYGNGAYVSAFPDEVSDDPVAFAELKGFKPQCRHLDPPQSTADENCEQGIVALRCQAFANSRRKQSPSLVRRQPISDTNSEPFNSFDATDTGGEIGTEKTAIGGLVRQSTHCRQSQVNGIDEAYWRCSREIL
jgi:hypothetical protein